MNLMTCQSMTIHWHGMLQQKSPWMDGVPYLSQCPIPPMGQFRYDFLAETEGTLFYHDHTGNVNHVRLKCTSKARDKSSDMKIDQFIGNLLRDGLNGGLIVRTPKEMNPYHDAYDYDSPCHTINVADWNHFPSDSYFPGYYLNESYIPYHPDVYLINGKGSYQVGQ